MIKIINESENKDQHLKTFKLSFDKEEIAKAKDFVEKKLAANLEIKGFRKGKVPIQEARKYLNADQVVTQTVDRLSNDGYDWIIDEYYNDDISPKKPIDFFIEKPKADLEEFKNDEAIVKYDFFLFPDIEINWDNLKLTTKKAEVTDEQIQKKIDQLLKDNATMEPKGDDAVLEKGDDAIFDFEGSIDGVKFEGGSAKDYELVIGSGAFIPGFEDQMIGMKPNEERDIEIKFPEDYPASNLAGKNAIFHITLKEVKKVLTPEYGDEFIKSLNYKNVSNDSDLRKYLRDSFEKENEMKFQEDANNEISELLLNNTKISYVPEFLIENEEKRMFNELNSMLSQYKISLEDYLKMTNLTNEKLKENFHTEAEKRIKLDIAINQISKEKDIHPTEEEINAEINQLEARYNPEHKKEISQNIRDQIPLITASIIQKMVYKYLFDLLTK